MRHLLFIIVFLLSILTAGAQELRVKSFTPLPMDLTARKQQRLDLNGKPCAMLKIMVMDDITDCNKSNIGDIATSGVMKLVYLPSVVRSVTLNFKYHYPLTITFADYGVTKLEGCATYELRLVDALQMMMENGNAAQQTATATTTQNVSSSQNSNSDLGISAEEANKIADEAYEAKDYAKAMKYYLYAAEKNNDVAQCQIGTMYRNGEGVTQDNSIAMKWYLKSAEQGNVLAQFCLGAMYYIGQGVTKDYAEAFKWYYKSAEQGNVLAQFCLGAMYYIGQGVAKDYAEAFKWYHKAAEQGKDSAMWSVALCYENGTGVEKNIDKAVYWYKKGAEKGETNCKEALTRLGY